MSSRQLFGLCLVDCLKREQKAMLQKKAIQFYMQLDRELLCKSTMKKEQVRERETFDLGIFWLRQGSKARGIMLRK